ncbi:MAG: hypothetical protein ACOCRK_01685 [bacterium]
MINRVNDYGSLNKEFEKLADVIDKQEKIKTFDIVKTEKEAIKLKKQLKVQGYQCEIQPFGDKFKVIAIAPDKVNFKEAMETEGFKKLAWGRYSFERQSAIGMFKYDYDDGSIWRVMVGEDGQEYLIKEVDGENEEDIVRTKIAQENIDSIVNENTVKTVMAILYDSNNNEQFINDLFNSSAKKDVFNMLNKKLLKEINATIQQNHFIQSPEYVNDVKGAVKIAIKSNKLNSKEKLNKLIKNYTNEMINKSGKMEKIFD